MHRSWLPTLALFLLPAVVSPAEENTGVFADNCAACHGADGRANTPQGRKLKAKDLRFSQIPDAAIERLIREGSNDKSGKRAMPAFGHELTEAQIQEAIRTVKSFRPRSAE